MQYNEPQLQAINSNANKIVCIASAGSGKTSVLLSRIDRLVSDGVAADSILVLTFTNAAAQELTDRYKKNKPGCITTPRFNTFHAFCYALIANDINVRYELGYTGIPSIASEDDIRRIWTLVKTIYNIKLPDSKLRGNKTALKGNDEFQYDTFWKAYLKQLCAESLITFDVLCDKVSKLFVNHQACIMRYIEQYKYVNVDEMQDTSQLQMDFVNSFTNSNIYVCGDPQQMLYRFRGCTNEIIKQLAEDENWELIMLPYNYRSTKQIVDFSNTIFAEKWKDVPYYIAGRTDKDGDPIYIHKAMPLEPSKFIDVVADMQADMRDGKSVAILCRTNSEVSEMQAKCNALNIPTRGKADNSEVIGVLRSSIDSDYCVKWLASLLPNEEYARYLRMSTLDDSINDEPKFIQTFGYKYSRLLAKIYHCRTLLLENKLPEEMIVDVAKYLRIRYIRKGDIENISDGINALISSIEQAVSDGIYIGTIHSVKGLEYDVVHVIDVDSRSFDTTKNEDEMACFYVACTRAKEHLHLWFGSEADF